MIYYQNSWRILKRILVCYLLAILLTGDILPDDILLAILLTGDILLGDILLAILFTGDIIDWRYFAWRYFAGDISSLPICFDLFRHPVSLPGCGHTFCRVCIEAFFGAFTSPSQQVSAGGCEMTAAFVHCPLCRKASCITRKTPEWLLVENRITTNIVTILKGSLLLCCFIRSSLNTPSEYQNCY